MSHFTKVTTQIHDRASLKKALSDLNYKFREGAVKVKGWAGQEQAADIVAEVHQDYGVGFKQNGDTYDMIADWWGVKNFANIQQEAFTNQLTQRYAYHVTVTQLQEQGYTDIRQRVTQDNVIELTVRV